MKALITAAGMGTRLGELTRENNKCLLKINNCSLLDIILNNLSENGINDIVIVTGHAFDKVEKKCDSKVKFIFNPFYRISGILPSIWMSKDYINGDEFLFVTSDSVYHPSILKRCLNASEDIVLCVQEKYKCDAEDSKVIIKNGKLADVGKDIIEKDATGEFMGMLKVSKNISEKFFDEVDCMLKEGKLNSYVADVIMRLKNKGVSIGIVFTESDHYIEVDTLDDLMRAKEALKSF